MHEACRLAGFFCALSECSVLLRVRGRDPSVAELLQADAGVFRFTDYFSIILENALEGYLRLVILTANRDLCRLQPLSAKEPS